MMISIEQFKIPHHYQDSQAKDMLIFIERNSYFDITITAVTTFTCIIAITRITESNSAVIIIAAITKSTFEVITIVTVIITMLAVTLGIVISTSLKQFVVMQI